MRFTKRPIITDTYVSKNFQRLAGIILVNVIGTAQTMHLHFFRFIRVIRVYNNTFQRVLSRLLVSSRSSKVTWFTPVFWCRPKSHPILSLILYHVRPMSVSWTRSNWISAVSTIQRWRHVIIIRPRPRPILACLQLTRYTSHTDREELTLFSGKWVSCSRTFTGIALVPVSR